MLLTASCAEKHSGYSCFTSLPENGWVYGDSLVFQPSDLDSTDARNVYIAIRHTNDYPYSNLWLEINICDSTSCHRDTLCMILADDFGRWNSKGIGPSKQFQMLLPGTACISDSTRISVRHIMRTDTLHGIEQVGVTVETSHP